MATNNLNISLISANQNQKEVTTNEAIYTLEALQNRGVIDKDLTTPPVTPNEGDLYIIATGATGDWATHDGKLACFQSGWKFFTPNEGVSIFVIDEGINYTYISSVWTAQSGSQISYDPTGTELTSVTLQDSTTELFNNAYKGSEQTGTSYTLAEVDANSVIYVDNATSHTLTIPLNSASPIKINAILKIVQYNTGIVTIQASAGVILNGTDGNSFASTSQYQIIHLIKKDDDTWIAN